MPTYEYACTRCGHELEAWQKMSDAPLTDCPACNTSDLRKKISAAGFQLKGSGWYATDFRDKGKAKSEDKPKEEKPKAEASPPCSTGACPAAS